MGINFSEINQCTKKCDCDNLGNLILKDNRKTDLNTDKKKETPRRNSLQISKDNNITSRFFSNQIIDYINDNKNESRNDNNISLRNNINTFRSTNFQTNYTNKLNNNKDNYNENNINKLSVNNDDNNNNEKNNDISNNNNINFNHNNVTIEKKEKNKDDSSIYDDNKDSFIKMEEKKEEEDKKFEKGLIQCSKIEEKNEKSVESNKEKEQTNLNLDNANIEDLMNIMEIKNIENDGTIIDYNGEQLIFKGKLDDKKNICGKGTLSYNDGRIYEGIFENCKLNGNGKYIASNGDIFEGVFINGNLTEGTIIKKNENKKKSNKSITQNDSSEINNEEYEIIYKGDIKDFKK